MSAAPKEVAKKSRDSFKDGDNQLASAADVAATQAFRDAIAAIPIGKRDFDEIAVLKFIKHDPVSALESPLVRKMIGEWYEAAGWRPTKDERRAARDNLETFADALRPRTRGPGAIALSARDLLRLFELCRDHYTGKAVKGAVASACALLLGMRATEIADRIVRDLDAGGTKLNITAAETRAGIRTMKVPTVLQPLLQELARGKQPGDRLFGEADRFWVRREVRRLCKLAGVPIVPPHGLRGTHGRLAVEAGISGDVVAASLGHESFAVTEAHYAGGDAVAGARIDRVAEALR